jgi:phosphatidylethanolamine/phosphatidyl-N-methylethanolamine N-methyltransferase
MSSILFFKKFLIRPKSIGAVLPSSSSLALEFGRIVDGLESVDILEVGPGTGSITKAIAHRGPKLVELDADLCKLLTEKFPSLQIVNSCCLEEMRNWRQPFGLIVSIPLINNPFKKSFLRELNQLYSDGLIKWCLIYTYGTKSPLEGVNFNHREKVKTVYKNIPPARIWLYK